MASSTTNIGLTKPAYNEDADIADMNGNMDILDQKLGPVGNTSLQVQADNLKGYKQLTSISTVALLESALNTEISSMSNHTNSNIRFSFASGAREGLFISNAVYHGTLCRKSSANLASIILYCSGGLHSPILGLKGSSGWNWGFIGSHIQLNTDDITWDNIWAKISMLSNGECATVYIHSAAMNALSGGARTGENLNGTIMRNSSDAFYFMLSSTGGRIISASVSGATSSSAGTYSEVVNATQCMETTPSSSDTVTFEVPLRKHMILLYARYMTSIFNANTASDTVFFGGDDPDAKGFDLTKAANSNTYTLTRRNGEIFYWATIIL